MGPKSYPKSIKKQVRKERKFCSTWRSRKWVGGSGVGPGRRGRGGGKPPPRGAESRKERSFFGGSHTPSTQEGTADSGKHALSVIEGDGSSQEQMERGFGGEGLGIVRGPEDSGKHALA